MRTLAATLAILLCSAASGQFDPTPQTRLVRVTDSAVDLSQARVEQSQGEANSVVIRVPWSEGNRRGDSIGSGVYLGSHFFATCDHINDDHDGGRCKVSFRDGKWAYCQPVARDQTWDMSIFQMEGEHPTLNGVLLTSNKISPGDQVFAVGYGAMGQNFRIFNGNVSGFSGAEGTGQNDWYRFSSMSVDGDSGGGVFTSGGRYIGPLWGSVSGETRASVPGRFQSFARSFFQKIAQWRAARVGQNQFATCLPGQPCYQPAVTQDSRLEYDNGGLDNQTPISSPSCPDGCKPGCQCGCASSGGGITSGADGKQGPPGAPGQDGTNGADGQQGERGLTGKPGQDGKDAKGIADIRITDEFLVIVTYDNGREDVIGDLTPPKSQVGFYSITPKGK